MTGARQEAMKQRAPVCQSVAVRPFRVADASRHEPRFGLTRTARRAALVALAAALLVGGITLCPGVPQAVTPMPKTARTTLGASTAAVPRLEAARSAVTRAQRPLLAVIGASFAAGVGAGSRQDSWAYRLARQQGWRIVVSAAPGAGFVNTGSRHLGPLSRLAGRLDLVRLAPALVIVQGGHNATRVRELMAGLRHAAPHARLAIISVFSNRRGPSRAARALDRVIVQAARAEDASVLVIDPLSERWAFPRLADGLHPSAAGHGWIAARLAQELSGPARRGAVVEVATGRLGQQGPPVGTTTR
jgi:acyl-CoA thioesterase I